MEVEGKMQAEEEESSLAVDYVQVTLSNTFTNTISNLSTFILEIRTSNAVHYTAIASQETSTQNHTQPPTQPTYTNPRRRRRRPVFATSPGSGCIRLTRAFDPAHQFGHSPNRSIGTIGEYANPDITTR